MKKLTKKGLIAYMEANPGRVVRCGDENKCLIADYIAHDLLEDGEASVSVDGCAAYVYPELRPDDDEASAGQYLLPAWAQRTVTRFDALAGNNDWREYTPRSFKMSTVLKKKVVV